MQLIHLNYKIGTAFLLKDLHLSFPTGMIIGFIGKNGSGKSTLLKILAGLLPPHEGRVLYQNQPTISYAPSTPFLFPHLTVEENFRWIASLRAVPKSQITKVVVRFQLEHCLKALYAKLSDGLKKRVGIASSFLHDPDILILDEPCATLDPKQRQFIWEQLRLYREKHRLILVSSHHPNELIDLCDHIYLLSDAKLHVYFPAHSSALFEKSKSIDQQYEKEFIE